MHAPWRRSSGIVVGCPGDVPGTSAEGSGVMARRERTTACQAHRDVQWEIFKARGGGQRRPGSWEKPSGRDPRTGQVRSGRGAGGRGPEGPASWTGRLRKGGRGPDPMGMGFQSFKIFNVVHVGCVRALVARKP